MKKSLIVLTALTGLLFVGCSSNRGGAYDQQPQPGYNSGTYDNNANPNLPPNSSGGPVRGPGTGGMGGTSTAPGSDSSSGTSDTDTAPDSNLNTPSYPNGSSQSPESGSQTPR